ncbi:hypothetical protein [Aquimarina sp. I32.4]|uniref:hypothetical protein n=1 Tax=Aquimarina sp. I32.4 TaxID=2053903 RepID=UPI000CDECA95|nr:hypothetical protein [Aquimarina sp. I32.4]
MKNLKNIWILLILIINFSNAQNDISFNLKGKVKELHTENFYSHESLDFSQETYKYYFNKQQKLTNYIINGILLTEVNYKYNKKGKLVSFDYEKTYGCESKEYRKFKRNYNKNTSIEEEFIFNTNSDVGMLLTKTIYSKYEDDYLKYQKIKELDKKVKEVFYTYENNKVSNIKETIGKNVINLTFKYNLKAIERIKYFNNKLEYKEIEKLNEYDLPKYKLYNSDDFKREITYKYEYDNNDNYVKQTAFENGEIISIEKRKITYYSNDK